MAEDVQSFLQEIDESLRVEKFEQLWKQYGKFVIAGCVGIVLFTMCSVLWKNHMHAEHLKQTDLLVRADTLAAAGKTSEAETLFEQAEKETGSLATLAKLRHAEILSEAGQNDKALALYKEIANSGGDNALRSIAARNAEIIAGNQALASKTAKPSVVSDALNNSPFSGVANELTALDLIKAGKNKEARETLDKLIQDNNAPKSERMRALELLSTVPEDKK